MTDNPYQRPTNSASFSREEGNVVLTDVRIPFGRMVLIILKWFLASIPAMIIVWLCMFLLALAVGGGAVFMHR